MRTRQRTLAFLTALAGLALLGLGAWGAWIPQPVAGLNILGVDLPEYVKFVPQVQSGDIALNRLVFFGPFVAIALGLLLLATVQQTALPVWVRVPMVLLAVPVALSMLPPAWTPPLLRTAEFRTQTLWIAAILVLVALSPLLRRYLPDTARGVLMAAAALLVAPALAGFNALRPALDILYHLGLKPGMAYYLVALGALLLAAGGVWLAIAARLRRQGAGLVRDGEGA